jgi:hypothetical protein
VPQLEQLGEATLEQLQDRDRRVAALQEELQHCYQHHRNHSSSSSSAVEAAAAAAVAVAAEGRSVSPRRRSRHRDAAGGSSSTSSGTNNTAQQQQQHMQQKQHLAVLAHSAHTLRTDLRNLAATVRRERAAVDSACDAALSSVAQRRRWSPSRRRYTPALTVAVSPAAATAPTYQQQAFSSSSDHTAAAAAAVAATTAGEAASRWRAQAERAASVLQLVAGVLSTELGVAMPQGLLMLHNTGSSGTSSDNSSGALPLRELEQFQAALTLRLQQIRSGGRSGLEAELATAQVCVTTSKYMKFTKCKLAILMH